MRHQQPLLHLASLLLTLAIQLKHSSALPVNADEIDGPNNRKLLGSSVVTSVSVIMDHANGTKTYITDGKPEEIPTVVGSPSGLLSPDRYEFYSFGKDGELVKKLMTLDQIQGLIAGGDELNLNDENGQPTNYYQQPLVQAGEPEGVSKVLESVQNVLKSELQTAHVPDHLDVPPVADQSWSILLPGFLNGELDYKDPEFKAPPTPLNITQRPATFPSSTTPSTTSSVPQWTSPRHPITTSPPKPQRQPTPTNIKRPAQTPTTTVKFSAHYTTPPPNTKNKPATVVKKPTGSPLKQQPVKTYVRTTSARPVNLTTTESSKTSVAFVSTARTPNITVVSTTFKPITTKATAGSTTVTTERLKPSGIPTITHYLPIHTSIGPSEAVKTTKPPIPTKPATPTKPAVRTTPKPPIKTTKPYVNKQPAPNTTQTTNKPSTLIMTTQNLPVAEKLIQKQPPSVEVASSNLISVSVSTPSGPPSTLKVTPPTTARPTSPAKPVTTNKAPVVMIQPNKTRTTSKPVITTPKKELVKPKPNPTAAINLSSVATHKPVVVMSSKPFIKSPQNSTNASPTTIRAPITSTTIKYVPPATTVQSRLPITASPEITSTTFTQVSSTTGDISTTLSNELDQAPLKLAVSLKEPEQNVFEKVPLLSTTFKEPVSLMTTHMTTESTTKWEQISKTSSAFTTTTDNAPTIVSTTDPSTIMTVGTTLITTEVPTTLNKVYIINNSEPQTIRTPLRQSPEKRPPELEIMASTILDRVTTRTEPSPTAGTTDNQPTLITTDSLSTITDSPSTTMFKDQVMEDGMSAVASILLDNNKNVVDKNVLTERLSSTEPITTTEVFSVTRPQTTIDDGPSSREEPEERNRGTTNRNDDASRTTTMPTLQTTTTLEPPIPTTFKIPEAKQNTSSAPQKKTTVKRDEMPPVKAKPIKESKLNPDSDEQLPLQPQLHAEGTTIVMEQVKLTEKISTTTATPPPPLPSVKVPLQEPKVPPPSMKRPSYSSDATPPPAIDLHPAPYESMGAEASTAFLAEDVRRFADLCNELAFRLWTALTSKGKSVGHISSRSLVMSPFAAISLLAMVFLGARGSTSGQMNEILRLDDMVTFNPHQVLQNVTDSVINSRNYGVATAAFVRQLYSDKSKGKILDFYKERAQQYYGGHVEEVSFTTIGDVIRRRTNLLVKRQTLGKVPEYLRGSSLNLRPPLAAFSANIFQTDCESGSTEGRDGEMYFVVRPSTRQRRLVPVPAVVWRSGFSAGYEPSLDATSVCLGQDSIVSTLLILPGQQGQVAPGDGLARLEQRLIETSYRRGGWSRLLRSLLTRPGLELQVPRFSHRSVLNVTAALGRMGLRDLFSFKADLRGLNGGANELHLSDMVQVNTFSTCGEEVLGARHHIETYPASPQRTGREDAPLPTYLDNEPLYEPRRPRYHFNGDDIVDGRPRTGRLPLAAPSTDPAPPRLRFDRPFLYIVRHNPSGIILHIGRFNPRLLP